MAAETARQIADALVGIVASLHVYFLVLEMFLWQTPTGLRVFGQTAEKAKASAVLAANQGLYNGFLAGGLFYSLITKNFEIAHAFQVFFLSCVIIAGLYGGWSVNKKIAIVQALPAAIALVIIQFLV